jgi:hypothetical protein
LTVLGSTDYPRQVMHQPPSSTQTENHRDRSLGLILFGGVEILIALGCAALIPLTLAAGRLAPGMDTRMVLPSLVLYAAIAAIFLTLGIGSIRARIWAQALTLSLSWVWLITGGATMLLTWIALPGLWLDLAASAGLEGRAAQLIAVAVNLVLSSIYIVLPGAFVLFYRSPAVIATCRARDPRPGWAGRCPQRLLALAAAYTLGGISIIAVPAYNFVFPLFGLLVTGAAGAVCWAAVLILSAALAFGTCRGEPWAWWTAAAASVAAAVSSVASFAFADPQAVFEAMALPTDQLMLMAPLWPREPWVHIVFWLAIWGSLLAYLFVVRPLFNPPLGRGRSAVKT